VLALDQSMTSTGWAHLSQGQDRPTWGKYSLPDWTNCEGEQGYKFWEWLGNKVVDLKVTHLVLENAINPRGYDSSDTEQIARWGMILLADMVRHVCNAKRGMQVDMSTVTSSAWRKVFIGTGAPPKALAKKQRRPWLKDKAIKACHARGWLVESDDCADALGILAYACAAIDPGYAAKQVGLFKRAELEFENEERSMR
jgi:hypothetical protein